MAGANEDCVAATGDVKSLERYLRSPDMASLEIIHRVQETRKHNMVDYVFILGKCVALLKQNLLRHPPPLKVIAKLINFCRSTIVELNQSKNYVREALFLREKRNQDDPSDLDVESKSSESPTENLESPLSKDHKHTQLKIVQSKPIPEDEELDWEPILDYRKKQLGLMKDKHRYQPSSTAPLSHEPLSPKSPVNRVPLRYGAAHIQRQRQLQLQLQQKRGNRQQTIKEEKDKKKIFKRSNQPIDLYQDKDFIPHNYFQQRLVTDKLPQGAAAKHPKSRKFKQQLLYIDCTCEDIQHVEEIIMAKKREELRPSSTRRPGTLFHYKLYVEQSPLLLPKLTVDKIMDAVVDPACAPEIQSLGLKILVKILIDIYCEDLTSGSYSLLTLAMHLIEGGSRSLRLPAEDMILNALDLLFNISIHVHLFEKVSYFGHNGTTPRIKGIQRDIFSVLVEVLLVLVHRDEKRKLIWEHAVNGLSYFLLDGGRLDRDLLQIVDLSIIYWMMRCLDCSIDRPDIHRFLVRIFTSRLYNLDNTVKLDLLEESGGLDFVFDVYTVSPSREAKENLFSLIVDVILEKNRDFVRVCYTTVQIRRLQKLLYLSGCCEDLIWGFLYSPSYEEDKEESPPAFSPGAFLRSLMGFARERQKEKLEALERERKKREEEEEMERERKRMKEEEERKNKEGQEEKKKQRKDEGAKISGEDRRSEEGSEAGVKTPEKNRRRRPRGEKDKENEGENVESEKKEARVNENQDTEKKETHAEVDKRSEKETTRESKKNLDAMKGSKDSSSNTELRITTSVESKSRRSSRGTKDSSPEPKEHVGVSRENSGDSRGSTPTVRSSSSKEVKDGSSDCKSREPLKDSKETANSSPDPLREFKDSPANILRASLEANDSSSPDLERALKDSKETEILKTKKGLLFSKEGGKGGSKEIASKSSSKDDSKPEPGRPRKSDARHETPKPHLKDDSGELSLSSLITSDARSSSSRTPIKGMFGRSKEKEKERDKDKDVVKDLKKIFGYKKDREKEKPKDKANERRPKEKTRSIIETEKNREGEVEREEKRRKYAELVDEIHAINAEYYASLYAESIARSAMLTIGSATNLDPKFSFLPNTSFDPDSKADLEFLKEYLHRMLNKKNPESPKKIKKAYEDERPDKASPIFSNPIVAHSVLAFSQHSLLLPFLEELFGRSVLLSRSHSSSSDSSPSSNGSPSILRGARVRASSASFTSKASGPEPKDYPSPLPRSRKYPESKRRRSSSTPPSVSPNTSLSFNLDISEINKISESSLSNSNSPRKSKASGCSVQLDQSWAKVNKDLLVFVLFNMYLLSRRRQSLIPELQTIFNNMREGQIEESHIYMIDDLLMSNDDNERRQGQNLIYNLKEIILMDPKAFRSLIRNAIDTVYLGLLSHTNPRVWKRIVSRIGFQILFNSPSLGCCSLRALNFLKKGQKAAVQMLDTSLRKVVISGEKDECNLVCMYNIIIDFISLKTDIPDYAEDTRYNLLINKYMCFPYKLLNRMNITLFTYMFNTLPHSSALADLRTTLLLIIIGRCRQNPRDRELVGTSFFRNLVNNSIDPNIVHHASQFLLEVLKQRQPTDYAMAMEMILQEAVQMNDEKLLFNPYLQLKSLMKLGGDANPSSDARSKK